MSLGAILPAASGIGAMQTWLDTSAGNIANANDGAPNSATVYRTQTPVLTSVASPGLQPSSGQGVAVASIALGPTNGPVAYDPGNPAAGAGGLVHYPAMSLGNQMVDLLMSQIGTEANVATINRATAAYQSLIKMLGG